jgi:hypothetical protein
VPAWAILLACDAEGVAGAAATAEVFVVDTAGGYGALTLTADLRRRDRRYRATTGAA